MISKIKSAIIQGISGVIVDIEVDISSGMPNSTIVGLAGTEVKESKERVKSAIENSGFSYPARRIVVNLSPADLKKDGSYLDLGICMGILRNKISRKNEFLENTVFLGELSLDGKIKGVDGVLSIALNLIDTDIKRVVIPLENYVECCEIRGIDIIPVKSVRECISVMNMDDERMKKYISGKREDIENYCAKTNDEEDEKDNFEERFEDIKGNMFAKRCAEISMAGAHNFLMVGPPGCGKTMIAKAMEGVMPVLDKMESLDITRIYSAAGKLDSRKGLVRKRPFRFPHCTATKISMIGGGHNSAIGEISLSHRGILFLDEMPEYKREALEALRQPMEDGMIHISRVGKSVKYPARFTLVATMNPCKCGYYNSSKTCTCSQSQIERYRSRISGPILDRIDIFCEVNLIDINGFTMEDSEFTSEKMKKRVEKARDIQRKRFENTDICTNSEMGTKDFYRFCRLDKDAEEIAKILYDKYEMSNRSFIRMLKTAQTIADLKDSEMIDEDSVLESFSLRKAFYEYFR